jgi:hypothetical protein
MLSAQEYVPPVRRLLQSEYNGEVITTDIDAGIACSSSGRMWTQSADETADMLHARAVTVVQIVHDLREMTSPYDDASESLCGGA